MHIANTALAKHLFDQTLSRPNNESAKLFSIKRQGTVISFLNLKESLSPFTNDELNRADLERG
jgi:hypothetical protein